MKQPINEIKKMQLFAGLINEIEYNDAVCGIDRNAPLTEAKETKSKELTIDTANPYEFRHGLQHELNELGEYTDEALEKAKETVLKNLAKDANFYSTLLNAKQSSFTFKQTETDKPGMQAKADGHLKKELKKDEKSNVKDNLGKKEEGSKKPKGVKIMPDKGVTGSEKTIKESKEEMNEEFKYFDNYEEFENTLFQLYPQVKANPEKYKTERNGEVNYSDGYVNWGSWNPNRPNTPSGLPPGAVNMNNKLSARDLVYPAGSRMDEHHNDPNFPGGQKILAMLDTIADDWGKDSDIYNDLEDAIVGWSDRNGELTPKGKIAVKALLSNWDLLDDYGHFLDDDVNENIFNTAQMGGVTTSKGTAGYIDNQSSPEDEFNQLMSKYDWYYEMSDDPRSYDRGLALDKQLKTLGKQIGADKAVDLFNAKAPSDRKVTSSFFMENKEDKHSKIKETLKTALKKEIINPRDIQAAKTTGDVVNIPVQDTAAQTAAKNAKINFRTYR